MAGPDVFPRPWQQCRARALHHRPHWPQ
jgi:hypothetical protein